MSEPSRGFGVPWSLSPSGIASAAARAEALGYASFWINHPGHDAGLERVAAAALTTRTIPLGIGVVPLSEYPPERLVQHTRTLALPLNRLLMGIGSGSGPHPLERAAEGLAELRAQLSCPLIIGALGPRMCQLAGAEADGVLLNWIAASQLPTAKYWVEAGQPAASRITRCQLFAYVRSAVGPDANARAQREFQHYCAFPEFEAHFERLGDPGDARCITACDAEDLQARLDPWARVLDQPIVRCLRDTDEREVMTLLEAMAPGSHRLRPSAPPL